MRFRFYALLCAFAFLCSVSGAQAGFVTVGGSHFTDLNGAPANAQICAQAVDLAGKGVSLHVGTAAGGTTTTTAVCTNVVAGVFSMSLPDTVKALPINSGFAFTATDNVSGAGLIGPGYNYVQPSTDPTSQWCSGGACNFDKLPPLYKPTMASLLGGPAGTILIGTVAAGATNAASVTNRGTASNAILDMVLPRGANGSTGETGRQGAQGVPGGQGNDGKPGPAGATGAAGGAKGDKGEKGNDGNITAPDGNLVGNDAGTYSTQTIRVKETRHFGDSISATNSTGAWPVMLAADLGVPDINRGVGGSLAADVATNQVFPNENPGETNEPLRVVIVGTNENLYKGSGVYETGVYRPVHQALLAWMATPSTSKVFGTGCNRDTSWTADDTYQTGMGVKSSVAGSVLTCPLNTYGGAIYIWYRVIDGNAGAFTYAVDGAAPVAMTTATTPAIAATFVSQSIALIRVPVGAGAHAVVIKPTTSSGLTGILAVGTAPRAPLYTGPVVLSAGVPRPSTAKAAAGQAAGALLYNADALADVTLLRGDGLRIIPVDVEKYYNPDGTDPGDGTAQLADVVHPTAAGHVALLKAFEAAAQFTPQVAPAHHKATFVTGDYTLAPMDTDVIVASTDGYGSSTVSLPFRGGIGGGQRISIHNNNGGASAVVRLKPSGGAVLTGAGVASDGNYYLPYGERAEIYFDDHGFGYYLLNRSKQLDATAQFFTNFTVSQLFRNYVVVGPETATLACSVAGDFTTNAPMPDGNYLFRALTGVLTFAAGSETGCSYNGPASIPAATGILINKTGNQWFAMLGPA